MRKIFLLFVFICFGINCFAQDMVQIPGLNCEMMKTEVTQKLFKEIMGNNPSAHKGTNNPVDNVSWYDAIKFCNALSKKNGLIEVYTITSKNDDYATAIEKMKKMMEQEGYPKQMIQKIIKEQFGDIEEQIGYEVIQNELADGFRLPTENEWKTAGLYIMYNSTMLNDLDKSNLEWCWDYFDLSGSNDARVLGSWNKELTGADANSKKNNISFRVVRNKVGGIPEIQSTATVPSKKQTGNNLQQQFDALGIKMIPIPGKKYEILSTEVTQAMYNAIMEDNPSESVGDNLPVNNVTWWDAISFCETLNRKFGLTEANGFRLPTSKEWEYAAKGGQKFTYSGSNDKNEVAWTRGLHPVAQKKPNGFGLYDMSGNVWEWCNDGSGNYHCVRGGNEGLEVTDGDWVCNGEKGYSCRLKWKEFVYLGNLGLVGFRVVRNIK